MAQLDDIAAKTAANAIRALSIDAVNAANSGHPGAPLGLADIATVLFGEVLRYDPQVPSWPNRDRFVLSNGHASMLQYACLHLAGYDLPLDEIRRFRQMGSKTPGHPEVGITPGVETTTGPLGQGLANAVGMALGRRLASARLPSADGFEPIDHRVFCIVGDGCLMEGISQEAASLAGHLGLGELVVIYDDNGISIDGGTDLAFSEDVEMRFTSMGWHTTRIDGHDFAQIRAGIAEGTQEKERPTLILARTRIGFGSPNREGKAKAHGEPFGDEEGAATKAALGWTHAPFEVPEAAYGAFRGQAEAGQTAHRTWQTKLDAWKASGSERASAWEQLFQPVPLDIDALLEAMKPFDGSAQATRNLSGKALNAIAQQTPRLIGGSADLTGSNKSNIVDVEAVGKGHFGGRNLHYGVREHAMAAMTNGLALYGGFVPYGATFLTFSDYMRNSVRLSALMHTRALQIYTHDSIGLGEDGPTHQPIEHLWALRIIPGLYVWRPADAVETTMAWAYAVQEGREAPHALVFSRQKCASLERPSSFKARDVWSGGYVVSDADGARITLIGTGTESALAVEVAAALAEKGLPARVVSMPCVERFLEQPEDVRSQVLPPEVPVATIEAGSTLGWKMMASAPELCFGVDSFGESAPAPEVYAHFGLTTEAITQRVEAYLIKA